MRCKQERLWIAEGVQSSNPNSKHTPARLNRADVSALQIDIDFIGRMHLKYRLVRVLENILE